MEYEPSTNRDSEIAMTPANQLDPIDFERALQLAAEAQDGARIDLLQIRFSELAQELEGLRERARGYRSVISSRDYNKGYYR